MNPNDPDIQIVNDNNDEQKTRLGWSKIVWGVIGIIAALAVVYFLILPRLGSDTTHSAAAQATEPAPNAPEDEVDKKVDVPSEEEKSSNENDTYCASVASSQDKTDRLYCDSLLPESRKVDGRLDALEGGSSVTAWLIVALIVLAASQVYTWTMLAKKRDKSA